ncbi:MAG: DUF4876 domain-containing protein [Prevotella sp.]|nr:DUF4876 domain-containing protein [Prevotella sp.]
MRSNNNHSIRKIGWTLTACLTVLLLASCVDFDGATEAISVKYQVQMPQGFTAADVANKTVTITSSSQTLQATTDANGIATFENIVPDVYDVSVAWKMTPDEYSQITGEMVQNHKYTVAGSKSAELLSEDITTPLTIDMNISVDQSILISKIYSAGSKDSNNKNYLAGRYIELYNNSDETVDIAGLYLGLIETNSSPAYTLGLVPDTIFMKQIFRIPTDKSYMVAPGQSVIITNSAIDHFTKVNPDLNNIKDPFEHNLLNADFEAKDQQGKTTNNPDVPALELVYTAYSNISNMNLSQGGPGGIVIFETEEDVANWPLAYNYGKTSGNKWMKLPAKYILDGVDVLKNTSQTGVDANLKRLYDYIDAGYAYINAASGYNGEVMYRKVQTTTEDGRQILSDTNNSLSDFAISSEIAPREFK